MRELGVARLSSSDGDFAQRLAAATRFDAVADTALQARVGEIIDRVREEGDAALCALTSELDRWQPQCGTDLRIDSDALHAAYAQLPAAQREALEQAAGRIRRYHEHQRGESWQYQEDDGTILGQQVTALEHVGVYVPGGLAAYPSSVLMNVLPARVAGVEQVVMVVPTPEGVRNPAVLAAAHIAGVDAVYAVGGAQAVAALAYGTQSIAPVDKIVGPGNAYVAAAKRQVFGQVAIDMIAGPSEICVICDGATDPRWIALDLFSQAEHDESAQAILISPDAGFLDAVEAAALEILPTLPRRDIVAVSLRERGLFIQVNDLDDALRVSNLIAPEHLELSLDDAAAYLPQVRHAGAIFLGRHTAEALGDYCAGPNHVLPTSRSARFFSPLGVYDFQKRSSIIGASATGAVSLGKVASVLARAEGLEAHALSAEARL